jgi:hypothetical protein
MVKVRLEQSEPSSRIDIAPVVDDIELLGLNALPPLEAEPIGAEPFPPDIAIDDDVAPIEEPALGRLLPEFDHQVSAVFVSLLCLFRFHF